MDASVGLCARCLHAGVQRNARGSRFWRCRLADRDPRRLPYPPLPVLRCPGFEEGGTLPAEDDPAPDRGARGGP